MGTTALMRCSGTVSISALGIIILFLLGCSHTPPSTYPDLEATLTLVAQQDSVALRYPVWAQSGMVYYVAYPENGDSTELRELNPVSGAERVIATGVEGPIAAAGDGKIAALEASYRIIVYDSLGIEVWAMNVGSTISALAFSADNNELYYCKNGLLLLISIGSSSPHDTILQGITRFSKSPNDSIFIYRSPTPDSLHTFYKHDIYTGNVSLILQEGLSAGFALNPATIDELAVGVAGLPPEQLLAKRILLYHIDYTIGRIFESVPSDNSSLSVESWAPDGSALLITITPYLEGDPITPLPEEIWMAEDIY